MIRLLMVVILVISIGKILTTTSLDLYEDQRNIVPLTDRTFFDNILHQDQLILINFYKHWSPECQYFSQIFKNFSKEILPSWSPVIKLSAINCAEYLVCYKTLFPINEINEDDYDDAKIDELPLDFPVIQVILPGTKEISKKENVKQYTIKNLNSIDDLYSLTLKTILANPTLSNKFSLTPLMADTAREICYTLGADHNDDDDDDGEDDPSSRKLHFAIIEPSPSVFGAMIILDLANYREFVTIKRFVIGDHHPLRSSLGLSNEIFSFPVILEFGSRCQYRVAVTNPTDLRQLRKKFVQSITQRYIPDDTFNENRKIRRYEEPMNVIHHNLSYIDLYNAIRYSLVHEITLRRRFNPRQLQIIKNLFHTILDYFPFNNENVRRFFKRMSGWLDTKHGSLDTERYLAAVRTSDGFLKPMDQWRHCNGSRPIYRGYPCGFWVLFHTMTVYEYNLTISSPKKEFQPRVLPVMREYIEKFFTCPQCRRYFLAVSQDLDYQLIYPNSSIMWLWRTHNNLNSRLAFNNNPNNDDTIGANDPFYPKLQFPIKNNCPNCFLDYDGSFNETEILKYLCNYYSKESIRNSSIQLSLSIIIFSFNFYFILFYFIITQ